MDRLSLLKETYDEIVEARYAAIANLQSCNEAVNDAQIGVQAARNQVNAAIAEDDEIGTKLTIMRNLIGESLEKSQSLQEKFNKLTSEQIDASRKRTATDEILKQCQRRLIETQQRLVGAEQQLAHIDEERDKISREIERYCALSAPRLKGN